MGKLLAVIAAAILVAGCSSVPNDVRLAAPVSNEVKAACKKDAQGCLVLPIEALKGALDEAFEMGRMIGIFQGQQ